MICTYRKKAYSFCNFVLVGTNKNSLSFKCAMFYTIIVAAIKGESMRYFNHLSYYITAERFGFTCSKSSNRGYTSTGIILNQTRV